MTTKTGLQLEGRADRIGSLNDTPIDGQIEAKPIVIIDDSWRRTFIPNRQVESWAVSPAKGHEKIRIRQRVATAGRRIGSVGPPLRISPFDEFGRRTYSMQGPRRQIDVVQGITEITPAYTRVQSMVDYVWDMRIATSSIPRETISTVLRRHIDESDPDARLKVVRLYIQAERYDDALRELETVLADFPSLDLQELADGLRQQFAQHLVREIQLRRDAGQHQRVNALLSHFPTKGIAGETLLQVREMLGDYDRQRSQYETVIASMGEQLRMVEDAAIRAELEAVAGELERELNVNTLHRMADYLRLVDDNTMSADQKIALAVSGWLLGSGGATENLAVAVSLFTTRNEIRTYLSAERPEERQASLQRIKSEEGGAPRFVAQLLAQMKPPIETQNPELEVPGFYKLTVPGLGEQPDFSYYLQLPPEYDAHRRYPCIVTLNGSGSTAQQQVDWWAGGYPAGASMRKGQAARHGYVVLAPEWSKPFQREYEYSAREHAAVLFSLRDACRRTSIDTDRVFLSGHSIGGDAAWDIGIAHPDLWAGVIPIVANLNKYIQHYTENARRVPMYFVGGEKDSGWLHENGSEFDRYLKYAGFDTTIVQFQGRGHEHFQDEVLRIFTWMELAAHRRRFFPTDFEAVAMRPWDNFFWWLELRSFPPPTMVLPVEWAPGSKRPSKIEAEIRDRRRISVTTGAEEATIWLSPEMVNLEGEFQILVNRRKVREPVRVDVEVMLEDVRTRADRQHPFWAKVVTRGRVR